MNSVAAWKFSINGSHKTANRLEFTAFIHHSAFIIHRLNFSLITKFASFVLDAGETASAVVSFGFDFAARGFSVKSDFRRAFVGESKPF